MILAPGCSMRPATEEETKGPSSATDGAAKETVGRVDLPLDHERDMRAAIDAARQVPELPFGAVLVDSRSGEIVARGHNRSGENPTFHGEIDVINRLAARAGRGEIDWSALVLYTTAEPCPMCQGAIEWAGIGNVVYGTSIETLQRLGWWQIDIRADEVIRRTPFRETRITGGVLEADCDALFVAVPKEQVPE